VSHPSHEVPAEPAATVFVVEDEETVRRALARLIRSAGMTAQTFPTAEAFLKESHAVSASCLVLDVRLPGLNGLQLQEALTRKGYPISIVFITGHGDVPTSVRAMKAGAVDFLQKPFAVTNSWTRFAVPSVARGMRLRSRRECRKSSGGMIR